MDEQLKKLLESAKNLVALLEQEETGLSSWHMLLHERMEDLRKLYPADLKRVLMELGNALVIDYRFYPSSDRRYHVISRDVMDPEFKGTQVITMLTEFLNEHEEARSCLRELGFDWSMPVGGFPKR